MVETDTADLSVAWVLGRFPSTAETFILRQITGLIDRGINLDLYAISSDPDEPVHESVLTYGLLDRVRYAPNVPTGKISRMIGALQLAAERNGRGWRMLGKSLSRRRFGRRAWSLRPFFESQLWWDSPRYDAVIASYGTYGATIAEYMKMGICSGHLITFFRGHDATRVLQRSPRFYDRLFEQGDLFLSVSEDLQRSLLGAGCPSDRLKVLREGVEIVLDRDLPTVNQKEGEPTHILSVCRLVEKKGLSIALEALAQVAASGWDFRYSIAGDGPLRQPLAEQAKRLEIDSRVHFLGWQDQRQVQQLLRKTHLVLSPSVTPADGDREGVPNTIKEAMVFKRPVVATYHGGVPEVIQDGVSGRLVQEYDIEGLASALIGLMASPGSWKAMGEAGRRQIKTMFDVDRINDHLAKLVLETIGRSCGSEVHPMRPRQ